MLDEILNAEQRMLFQGVLSGHSGDLVATASCCPCH
jgi:hypothetical protein